jgi:tRNA 2-thiouridine synthesizing protein A
VRAARGSLADVEQVASAVIDCLGMHCPVPVIHLARAVGEAEVGAAVELLADDPGAKVDIPVWCRMKSHELVAVDQVGAHWRFTVRRTH